MTRLAPVVLLACASLPSCSEPSSPAAGGESSTTAAGEDTKPADDGNDGDEAIGESTTAPTPADSSSGGADTADDETGSNDETTGGGGGWDPTAIPVPTAPCPDLEEGWNTFCPAGIEVCREAYVRRSGGTGGPLNLYWHGTYENAVDVQMWGAGQAVLDMTLEEDGMAFYPEADPDAVARPNNPYPWWIVGNSMNERKDDFFFLDEMIACAAESGLVDMDRINTGGMSAGGMMTSHLVSRRGYWSSAVSWSGGWAVPIEVSQATPTMVIHGGPGDCFGGWCGFMNQSEFFAEQLVGLGVFAFLCDHSEGDDSHTHHADALGAQGADFMRMSRRGETHPWDGYPFGSGGDYMLDNYCYDPGTESPWSPWDN